MQVAFTQHDEVVASDFHFITIVRAEKYAVAHFGCTNILAQSHDFGPREPLGYLGSCGDDDSPGRAAFAFALRDLHQQSIVQHLDGEFPAVFSHEGRVPARDVRWKLIRKYSLPLSHEQRQ